MSDIIVKNVTKKFGHSTVLKDVSLTFENNKIYGLFGRNGAGKSTLLNLITNKLFPDTGEVTINQQNVKENDAALKNIYCMSEQNYYPPEMKVSAVYYWSRQFYPNFNLDYAYALSEKFGLDVNKNIRSLSTGYSSIYKIIVALSCQAPVILLDEPILGLDAVHRELFYKELIANYIENPKTFVISTHLIDEVANLIERVIFLSEGKVILDDTAEEIATHGYAISGPAPLVESYLEGEKIIATEFLGGLKTAYVLGKQAIADIPNGLEVSKLDLQKFFIKLTSK